MFIKKNKIGGRKGRSFENNKKEINPMTIITIVSSRNNCEDTVFPKFHILLLEATFKI